MVRTAILRELSNWNHQRYSHRQNLIEYQFMELMSSETDSTDKA
jgi:hypothetical protein